MARWTRESQSTIKRNTRFYKPILEALEDRYVPSGYSLALDFGTTSSPLAAGYQRGILQNYTALNGYGWQSLVGLQAINRTNITNALTRDLNQGASGTYEVALANGNYNVSIEMGDAGAVHNNISVWLNNQLVISNQSTSKGQFVTRTFPVQISNGLLLARLSGNGGRNSTFALVSLSVAAVTSQPPTDISLSNSSVSEGLPVGTSVGTFTTADPIANNTFTYSLVSGTGSTDNALFTINGNQLSTNSIFSYATQSTRNIRVRTTDASGLWYEKAFTISILPVNHAPTDIQLSNSTLPPNQPIGTLVGSLTTTDPDLNNTFTYSLVSGTGSTDNARFTIVGNQLDTAQVLPIGTYSIRVRTTDQGGLYTEKVFSVTAVDAPAEQLVHRSDVQYLGAFRVPNYYTAVDEFSYGGTALAFNAANNSLFIVGQHQGISEISIPTTFVNSNNLNNLATATVLQPWMNVLSRLPSPLIGATDGAPIGGLLVQGNRLIGTDYAYYSGANTQTQSHFYLDSLNLSSANIQGLFQVGNATDARRIAGYMTPIPSEWQGALGAPDLTGLSDACIVSTSSSGPAAFGFDPSTLGGVTPATCFLSYPVNQPLGPYEGPANPIQSGTVQIGGVVFVPGTSSILYFGTTGTNYNGYGIPQDWGDNVHDGTGPHSLNGEYAFQVWGYNANDLVASKIGQLQPWQVQPYDVWNFTVPIPGNYKVGGVAFDPTTSRVYLSVLNADTQAPYSSLPLIEVFHVLTPTAGETASAPPEIGTIAATTTQTTISPTTSATVLVPGPIPSGTPMVLTAGNVYSPNPASSVNQVAFYRDSNNDGVLEVGTDQLLGYGAASTTPNANHNWSMTISTVGWNSGTYTIFAQALGNGLVSDPIATAMMIS